MESLLRTFKALGDKNRLRIIAILMEQRELCACQIIELLGVAGATTSKHLSQLQQAGLVRSRKEGRWAFFSLNDDLHKSFPYQWLQQNFEQTEEVKQDRKTMKTILKEKREDICRRQRGEDFAEQMVSPTTFLQKKKILVLCTGNSCRSQMAEGWIKALKGDLFEVASAGIETHGLNPNAVKVMAEVGVDISKHSSQNLDDFDLEEFDYILTVCDHAHESCPLVPPGCKVIHRSFEDPPRLAKSCKSENLKLDCYRKVRDEIKKYIQTLPNKEVQI